ncbi:MAG: ATP-binding protein [Mesorhizobium sp.]|nr:MAG: ATP-binding protein [Mesorhizobium sp.]
MFDSLRGIGYSTPTAIADLIDNSITAGARRVRVDFIWRGDRSVIRVLDDGRGMPETRLIEAMRPASHDPSVARHSDDLGRFGLGLKTASLSQGRLLSVVTRSVEGGISARFWDLDHVLTIDKWHLLHGIPTELTDDAVLPTGFASGTIVVIGRLDRVLGVEIADETLGRQRFHAIARNVERHLGMTFHRYIEGSKPELTITFNGDDNASVILPWDPFMQTHPATTKTPVERFNHSGGSIEVQGFVLPHRDRLTSDQFENAEGPSGWLGHEGFFVYRGRRLLASGGWMGLGPGRPWVQNGMHRLARLRLDLPTSGDHLWKVDIRKSSATPPAALRNRLQGLAEKVRRDAREIFAHRSGRPTRQAQERMVRAWTAVHDARGISYKVDRTHPSVRRVLDAAGDQRRVIEDMLSVIESTVPVQRIWMDHTEGADLPAPPAADMSLEERTRLASLYRHMRTDLGLSADAARERLTTVDPFAMFPDAVSQLPDEPA